MGDSVTRTLTHAWIMSDGTIQKADSQQLPQDPYSYQGVGEAALLKPPYDMDELIQTLESNTLHARCVKQKASDTLGRGITLKAKELPDNPDGSEPAAEAPTDQEGRWNTFVEAVESDPRGEGSFKERLTWAAEDYESVGWAVLEFSRDAQGNLDGMWHIPGHTVRAHVDGIRYAQKRSSKLTWFKKFGVEGTVDAKAGTWADRTVYDKFAGNEILVIRNRSPRSDYYGLPDHVPALAAIAGWRAQHEFNVRFFGNQAVPSYAVIIEGADISPELEDKIRQYFLQIKGDPSKTLIIPIPGIAGDEAAAPKVRFERLAVDIKDASFRMYKQDNALEICIAHGMPPYRVGWPIVGSLGGATAEEMTQIYNDAIIQARQETWEQRLNRAVLGALDINGWQLKCAELDMRNELRDLNIAKEHYLAGRQTPNDGIRFFGMDERDDPGGNEYIKFPYAQTGSRETVAATAGDVTGGTEGAQVMTDTIAKAWIGEVREMSSLRARIEKALALEAA